MLKSLHFLSILQDKTTSPIFLVTDVVLHESCNNGGQRNELGVPATVRWVNINSGELLVYRHMTQINTIQYAGELLIRISEPCKCSDNNDCYTANSWG